MHTQTSWTLQKLERAYSELGKAPDPTRTGQEQEMSKPPPLASDMQQHAPSQHMASPRGKNPRGRCLHGVQDASVHTLYTVGACVHTCAFTCTSCLLHANERLCHLVALCCKNI